MRSFSYELNQIPYECTVKVTNRFRGLNLVDSMPEGILAVCGVLFIVEFPHCGWVCTGGLSRFLG